MNFDPLSIIFLLLALIVGLVLHEFMHAYVGYRLGDDTARANGRITLNPLAHIDPFTTLLLPLVLILAGLPPLAAAKPVPFDPWALKGGKWGAAAVAAAGPLTNLMIAAVCGLWLHVMVSYLGGVNEVTYRLLASIVTVNVGLFVFNSIPLPPLDGSRVLYAVSPAGLRNALDTIERAGLAVILVFVLLLSYYPPLGALLGRVISFFNGILLPQGIPGL